MNRRKYTMIKEAFAFYCVGSVVEMHFVKHDWFTDNNIKEGYHKALKYAFDAFDEISSPFLYYYKQKGTLNIYPGQELNPLTRALMDLFEILMFGNYTSNANINTPESIKFQLCIKAQSVSLILSGKSPATRSLVKEYHKLLEVIDK